MVLLKYVKLYQNCQKCHNYQIVKHANHNIKYLIP